MADAAAADVGARFHDVADAFAEVAGGALANGASSGIASSDLERALTAAIKLYAAKAEAEGRSPAIVLVVSELLRAADISLFDLAMWYRRGERA
jgi:hypothetical protein